MTDSCPPAIRRALRQKLGSRTMRRAGVKSHRNPKPHEMLRKAIKEWMAAGRPEVKRRG